MSKRNENRPGYKKTKVGWTPEEWRCVKTREICRLSSGGTPDRKISLYWNGDIYWATTSEINYNVILRTAEKITEHGLKQSSAKVFPKGTLLMAMYGQGATRGRVALLGRNIAINQTCVAILPKKDDVLTLYLYHLFSYEYNRIRSFSQGGNQQNLSSDLVGSVPIIVPSFHEQKKIAEILSTWDEAIEQMRKLIDAKKRLKKALMQQLLTSKKRLPGFKEEWKTYRLSELSKLFPQRMKKSKHSKRN